MGDKLFDKAKNRLPKLELNDQMNVGKYFLSSTLCKGLHHKVNFSDSNDLMTYFLKLEVEL